MQTEWRGRCSKNRRPFISLKTPQKHSFQPADYQSGDRRCLLSECVCVRARAWIIRLSIMHLRQQCRAEQILHLPSVNKGELSWRRLLTLLERDSDLENELFFLIFQTHRSSLSCLWQSCVCQSLRWDNYNVRLHYAWIVKAKWNLRESYITHRPDAQGFGCN